MRQLTDHIVHGDSVNHQIEIKVMDEPGQGGACHEYRITGHGQHPDGFTEEGFPTQFVDLKISFQNGPIKEFGVNGVTQEALLAVVIDRLRSFQAGPFASIYNQSALESCENALKQLQHRTRERLARGVEGTHQQ